MEEFRLFKELAEQLDIEIWFSATIANGEPVSEKNEGVPGTLRPFMGAVAVLITLDPHDHFIHLNLVKDHDATPNCDLHLKLDPRILLIADEM
jgi:hypothetical protein